MKKSLLFGILAGAVLVTLPVTAAVSVEETTDIEYIINSGFSQATAEDVFLEKNRVTGKPVEPLYEKDRNKFLRFCRTVYSYADPSIDEADRIHHDIKLSPSYSDL